MSHRVSDKRVPCKSVRPTRVSQSVQQECQTLFGRLFSGACVPILFLTVHYLQILSALCCGVAMDVNLAAHFKHGRQQLEGLPSVAKLSDQVMVILGLNPGPYTLQGTNCYLIGRGRKRVLVDTGEGRAEFVESLVQVLHGEDCEITDVIPNTHSCGSYWGPARFGAKVSRSSSLAMPASQWAVVWAVGHGGGCNRPCPNLGQMQANQISPSKEWRGFETTWFHVEGYSHPRPCKRSCMLLA